MELQQMFKEGKKTALYRRKIENEWCDVIPGERELTGPQHEAMKEWIRVSRTREHEKHIVALYGCLAMGMFTRNEINQLLLEIKRLNE